MSRQDLSLSMLDSLLMRGALSEEQRQRLVAAGRDLFRQSPRAAMGVTFNQFEGPHAIIVNTQQGFDSARVLKPGDEIHTFDGLPVDGRDELRVHIVSHDPGDLVKLGIVRAGQPMRVELRLGDYRELGAPAAIDPQTMKDAWELRVERTSLASTAAPVLDLPLTEDGWIAMRDAASTTLDESSAVNPSVVAGGKPRGAEAASMSEFPSGAQRTPFRRAVPQSGMADMERTAAALRATVENNDRLINDPAVPLETRQQLRVRNDDLRNTLRVYERLIQRMKSTEAPSRRTP